MSGLLFRHKAAKRVGHTTAVPFGLGPNAPNGLETPFPIFYGDELPARGPTFPVTNNQYGMGNTYDQQQYAYSLVADPENEETGTVLRFTHHGWANDRAVCGASFPPNIFGGQSPGSGYLRSDIDDQNWQTLYVRAIRRFSPNFTIIDGNDRTMVGSILDSGTMTSGTTVSVINDSTKSWTVNQWAGKWLRNTSTLGAVGKGWPIASNTATSITFVSPYRTNYALGAGQVYIIYDIADTGAAVGQNTGVKGFFWPKIYGRRTYANVAATPPSVDSVGSLADNHFIGGFTTDFGDPTLTEGIDGEFHYQGAQRWDGSTVDGNGYPVWTAGRATSTPFAPCTGFVVGEIIDEEWELVLNTPGVANGIYRYWLNGVLQRSATDKIYAEAYVSANQAQITVTVGGVSRNVALAVSEVKWGYMWQSFDYGGGLKMPEDTIYTDLHKLIVAGKP